MTSVLKYSRLKHMAPKQVAAAVGGQVVPMEVEAAVRASAQEKNRAAIAATAQPRAAAEARHKAALSAALEPISNGSVPPHALKKALPEGDASLFDRLSSLPEKTYKCKAVEGLVKPVPDQFWPLTTVCSCSLPSHSVQ